MRRASAGAATVVASLVASLVTTPSPTGAQSWRTVEVARQLHDSGRYRVKVQYGAGRLALRVAEPPYLYQMRLRYDEERAEPLHRFDAAERDLALGIRGVSSVRPGRHEEGSLRVALTAAAPLDLSLELGAVEARLDLGGLAVEELRLSSGASDVALRFAAPNRVPMRALTIEAGAANVQAAELANARAAAVRVKTGVGNVELDFGGEWARDVDLSVDVALGRVRIRVPPHVGVRVEIDRVLASFDRAGLVRRGGAYYSENWETAARRLHVDAQTVLGGIELDRSGG